LVGKVTDPSLKAEEREIEEVYEDGVIPESEGKVVSHLFVEADGTSIALQREEARRAEVKAGIAYEGWHKVSRDRYRVKDKTVYSGIMNGEKSSYQTLDNNLLPWKCIRHALGVR
jgi:hypothetical protein